MFEIIFLLALSFYFIQLIVITIGAGKNYSKIHDEKLPGISVIVAARNEEDNILECLESLNKLNYPEDRIEIILVNDHSADKTGEIIKSFIMDKPKFKTIIPGEQIGNLKGKTNALANAIKISHGDIILTTDADCTVPVNWAKTIASYFDINVGFVGGYTTQNAKNMFEGMQATDFIYLLTVAAGSINLGKPLSCIGNNMAFRKTAYFEVGGYENLPFSVTEDSNLLIAINNLKKYKIIYPLDEKALVTSKPCKNWKTIYWQKKRWGVGAISSDFIGYLVMAWGYITHIAMLITPLFFSVTALYLCLFKIFVDYFFVYPVFKKLKLDEKFNHFIAFELYFIIYVIALPFIVFTNQKVKWKGREY